MSYRVVRFYRDHPLRRRIIRRGLTLAQAQAHCSDPETSSSTCVRPENRRRTRRLGAWFDGGISLDEALTEAAEWRAEVRRRARKRSVA